MLRAIIFMLIGMALIPTADTASKLLSNSHGYQPLFVAWSRFAIGTLMVLPLVPLKSFKAFKSPLAWLRGLILAIGISSISIALSLEDLADVFGVFFIAPIISYMLATLFLRETINLQRTVLLLIGFCGVLLIARPGYGLTAGHAFGILAGTSYGLFLTLSRLASHNIDAFGLLITQLAIAGVITAPAAILFWPSMNLTTTYLLVMSGGASMLGNLFLILAYGLAPATQMAPYVYFQLPSAVILGWVVFGSLPDIWGVLGLGLLVFSGLGSALVRR